MANNLPSQKCGNHVEIQVEISRKSCVKKCVQFQLHTPSRVKLILSTIFSNITHNFLHNEPFSVSNQLFPHFHRPYYYYNYLFNK